MIPVPDERMKVDYPAIVAVRAPEIPEGATDEERAAIEDREAVAALSLFLKGHGACGGWRPDPETEGIRCDCGTVVYPLPTGAGAGEAA